MLELTTRSGTLTLQTTDNDYSVTRKYSGVNTLHFSLPPGDPGTEQLSEEALIRDTDSGQLYRIKGLRITAAGAEAEARLCLDDWEATAVTSFSMKGASVSSVMTKLCPGRLEGGICRHGQPNQRHGNGVRGHAPGHGPEGAGLLWLFHGL